MNPQHFLLPLFCFTLLLSAALAQKTPDEVAEAKEMGVTVNVTTTMRVESGQNLLLVTGKHELLRAMLLAFIQEQGMEGLVVTFPKVQLPDGSEIDSNIEGFVTELVNGYHRFLLKDQKVAIAASESLEEAVDMMFDGANITVYAQNPKQDKP